MISSKTNNFINPTNTNRMNFKTIDNKIENSLKANDFKNNLNYSRKNQTKKIILTILMNIPAILGKIGEINYLTKINIMKL
jgi:hypothetical protein